jgi:hypothetical protein
MTPIFDPSLVEVVGGLTELLRETVPEIDVSKYEKSVEVLEQSDQISQKLSKQFTGTTLMHDADTDTAFPRFHGASPLRARFFLLPYSLKRQTTRSSYSKVEKGVLKSGASRSRAAERISHAVETHGLLPTRLKCTGTVRFRSTRKVSRE